MSCLISYLCCCFPSLQRCWESDEEKEARSSLVLVTPPNTARARVARSLEAAQPRSIKKTLTDLANNGLAALADWKKPLQPIEREGLLIDMQTYTQNMIIAVDQMLKRSKAAQKGRENLLRLPVVDGPIPGLIRENDHLSLSFWVHELRAPLANLSELLQTPLEETLNEEFYADLETCYNRIQRLVDQLPENEGEGQHPLHLETKPFTIETLCREVRAQIGYSAKAKGVQIRFFPQNIPEHLIIKGDKYKIEQIFENFISNAIKYSLDGQFIDVGVQILEERDSFYTFKFSVRNSGHGISKIDQLKLFRPFSQVGAQAQTKVKTSGLGLCFCKQLAEILNDSPKPVIGVESEQGQGSCFWFTARLDKMGVAIEPPRSPRPSPSQTFSNKHLRVLVAEDVQMLHKLIRRKFVNAGCSHVEFASDGQEAIDKFFAGDYDFVFLDMMMPHFQGWEVAKRIQEQIIKKKPHIIIVSGTDEFEVRAKLRAEGIEKDIVVFPKEFQYNLLVETVNKMTLPN